MRIIRVRTCHVQAMIGALEQAGFQAEQVAAPSQYMGGCADPGHCSQHPDAIVSEDGIITMPDTWCGIRTDASGRAAHRIWTVAGIV